MCRHRTPSGGEAVKLIAATLSVLVGLSSTSHAQAPQPSTAPASQIGNVPAVQPSNAQPTKNPEWKDGDNCVNDNTDDINVELKSGKRSAGPELLSATYFLPTGASVQLVLNEPFREGRQYFGYIEREDNKRLHKILGRGLVSASRIPEDYSLVKKELADKTDTLLTLRVPESMGSFWKKANLYIYTCTNPGMATNVSQLTMRVAIIGCCTPRRTYQIQRLHG